MLFEARKLAGLSRGRHAIKWNLDNPLATPLTPQPPVRVTEAVVNLLTLDAEVLARRGRSMTPSSRSTPPSSPSMPSATSRC